MHTHTHMYILNIYRVFLIRRWIYMPWDFEFCGFFWCFPFPAPCWEHSWGADGVPHLQGDLAVAVELQTFSRQVGPMTYELGLQLQLPVWDLSFLGLEATWGNPRLATHHGIRAVWSQVHSVGRTFQPKFQFQSWPEAVSSLVPELVGGLKCEKQWKLYPKSPFMIIFALTVVIWDHLRVYRVYLFCNQTQRTSRLGCRGRLQWRPRLCFWSDIPSLRLSFAKKDKCHAGPRCWWKFDGPHGQLRSHDWLVPSGND